MVRHTATSNVTINAEPEMVWAVLTDAKLMGEAFFGSTVKTDWTPGNPITFSGEWEGKSYQDKGKIVRVEPPRLLQFTHFSPLTGLPDVPKNWHTISFELTADGPDTLLTVSQDNTVSEVERDHSSQNWSLILGNLKKIVEHVA